MTFRLLIIIMSLSGCLFTSCEEDKRNEIAVERVIKEEVDKKIANYIRTRNKRCLDKAIDEANEIADSILLTEARLARDTADKPPKPVKPEKPEIKTLLDSTPIAPIISKDTIK
jgi:hypothetical protein